MDTVVAVRLYSCFMYLLYHKFATFASANLPAFHPTVKDRGVSRRISLNPQSAKRLGRSVLLRPDWEEIKYDVMYQVCKAKFQQNPDLGQKLLKTGNAELIEGNTWGDRIWGVCKGIGENNLGKTLMRVRDELRSRAE